MLNNTADRYLTWEEILTVYLSSQQEDAPRALFFSADYFIEYYVHHSNRPTPNPQQE